MTWHYDAAFVQKSSLFHQLTNQIAEPVCIHFARRMNWSFVIMSVFIQMKVTFQLLQIAEKIQKKLIIKALVWFWLIGINISVLKNLKNNFKEVQFIFTVRTVGQWSIAFVISMKQNIIHTVVEQCRPSLNKSNFTCKVPTLLSWRENSFGCCFPNHVKFI